jgi:hypothetical protein
MADDPVMINKEKNENNTDVDRRVDARRLRIRSVCATSDKRARAYSQS